MASHPFPGGLSNALRLVEQAMRANDMPGAMRIAAEAVAGGAGEQHGLLTLAACQALNEEKADEAVALAQRARKLNPRSVDALQTLGAALAAANRKTEALEAFDAALKLAPAMTLLRYNRGRMLEDLNELTRARRDFERVLDAEPAHVGALARLATMLAAAGENEAARAYAERSLRADPSEAAARFALARIALNEGDFDKALAQATALASTQSAVNRSIAQGLMADALDGLGRIDEAFVHYAASNRTLKSVYAAQLEAPGLESALDAARRIARHMRNTTPAAAAAPEQPVATHVFLIGFPRSGTTLLEQVLASHPAIETLEERDCLAEAERDFLGSDAALDALIQADLEPYREAYWAEAAAGGALLDKPVFVDKLPLNAVNLLLVARLFPAAKILLALRDPRDVVLSCFRRRFGMSLKMYEMLALDRAAAYYDAVMEICEAARATLPLAFQPTRHEDLVRDLEAEARNLCGFLGVDYSESMRDFAARAREKVIATPSASQVREGLSSQGIGRWRAYREQLAPVLPILQPWVHRFGYEGEQ
jgi:tetratricopeptide (TPR) repeat protein